MPLSTASRPHPQTRLRQTRTPPLVAPRRRARRIVLVAALVVLVPAAFSYVKAIAAPSNSSLGIRSVEWLREHGAAGVVSQIESTYYSLTAPSKGGPTLRALPAVGARGGTPPTASTSAAPSTP